MGRSLYATLAFGIDLGYEDEREFKIPAILRDDYDPDAEGEDDDGDSGSASIDFDAYIARKAGLAKPKTRPNHEDADWKAFWAAERAAKDAFPLTIERRGVDEYMGHMIALKRTVQKAEWSLTAVEVTEITADEIAFLKAFFEETGLPWSEPRWSIFGLYW
jgi:hypothetical protein